MAVLDESIINDVLQATREERKVIFVRDCFGYVIDYVRQ